LKLTDLVRRDIATSCVSDHGVDLVREDIASLVRVDVDGTVDEFEREMEEEGRKEVWR
jgi:hypothetical protein